MTRCKCTQQRHLLLLLLTILNSNYSTASFLETELPLNLTSFIPAPFGDCTSWNIFGLESLTLVFSRPVIALGSDVEEHVDYIVTRSGQNFVPNNPFFIELFGSGEIHARVRWVTTFIARLDPIGDWNNDLTFRVSLNPDMRTHDGIPLSSLGVSADYATSHQGADVVDIFSEKALEVTDNKWESTYECPPDGEVTVQFRSPVYAHWVESSLEIRSGDGSSTSGITVGVEECEVSESCVILKPRGFRADTEYVIIIREGSHLHPLAGRLQDDITLVLSGLQPFIIDWYPDSWHMKHNRYDIDLRLGLCERCSLDDIEQEFRFQQDGVSLPFTVDSPEKATIRLVVPDVRAPPQGRESEITISYTKNSRSADILDGFDQPLESFEVTYELDDLNSFWSVPNFELLEDIGEFFPILTRGESNSERRHVAEITEITPRNFQDEYILFDDEIPLTYTGANNQVTQPRSEDEFEILKLAIPKAEDTCPRNTSRGDPLTNDACISSSFFRIDYHSGDWDQWSRIYERYILVTDLAISYVSDQSQQILIWVTRMSTGEPVRGADISVHQFYTYSSVEELEIIVTGVTDEDGIFEHSGDFFDIADSWRYDWIVHATYEQYQGYMNIYDPPYFYLPDITQVTISDRAQYKPGDSVYFTGYIRGIEKGEFFIPELENDFEVDAFWDSEDDECPRSIRERIFYDIDHASFSGEFQIPECVSPGDVRFSIDYEGDKDLNGEYDLSLYGTTTAIISDPRRPTGFMTMLSDEVILRPGESLPLHFLVTTGTQVPIQGAEISISWRVSYGQNIWSRWGYYIEPEEDSSDWINFEMVTRSDGTAELDFGELVADTLDVSERDRVEILAEWIDPTGALVQEDMSFEVLASEWTLNIVSSLVNPLPGLSFGLYVSIEDLSGNQIEGEDVEIQFLRNTYDDNEELVRQELISTCSAESDGGVSLQCGGLELPLDDISEFSVFGSLRDDRGGEVSEQLFLGRDRAVWEEFNDPIYKYDPLYFFFDKSSYDLGDDAYLTFDNPFIGAHIVLNWGNIYDQRYEMLAVSRGFQRIPIRVTRQICGGGCTVNMIMHVPRQHDNMPVPQELPINALWDYQSPRTIVRDFTIDINSPEGTDLDVSIELSDDKVLPSSSVDITVNFEPEDNAQWARSAQIAVFVVDKAYLEIVPNPMTSPQDELHQFENGRFERGWTVHDVTNWEGVVEKIETFTRRMSEDEWITPDSNWDPSGWANVDMTDEQFWDDENVALTYQNPSYGFTFSEYNDRGTSNYCCDENGNCNSPWDIYGSSGSSSGSSPGRGGLEGAPGPDGGDGGGGGRDGEDGAPGRADESEASPSSAGPAATSGSSIEARDTFSIVPLFIGNITTRERFHTLSLDLPDNIGTFVIRAYVADSDSRFGSAETELVVSKPIAMEPKQPRFARIGDRAEIGVSLMADDPNYDNGVLVSYELSSTSDDFAALLSDETEKSVLLSGTSPISITWDVVFSGIGMPSWTIFADDNRRNTDGLLSTLEVKTVMDPIFVATSMAITANNEGTPWQEWIEFPEVYSDKISRGSETVTFSDNDATIEVTAGVGRLTAIQNFADQLLFSFYPLEIWRMTSYFWLHIKAADEVFDLYPPTDSDVVDAVSSLTSEALSELERRTDDDFGLRYYDFDFWRWDYDYVDLYLNLHALYLDMRFPGMFPDTLTDPWESAVNYEMTQRVERNYTTDFDALAQIFLIFGLDWVPDTNRDYVRSELSFDNLLLNFNSLSFEGQLDFALAHLLRDEGLDNELILSILQNMFNDFRIQGQTAYLGDSQTGNAYSHSIQSKALTSFLNAPIQYKDSLVIEKLANYLSQNSIWIATRDVSLAWLMISLSDYDTIRGTLSPDLELSVISGDFKLIDDEIFRSASQPPVTQEYLWTEVSEAYARDGDRNHPDPVEFIAKGDGEVSVSVGLRFMPPIYETPVYRGILVERIVRRVDPITRSGHGPSLMLVESGEIVEISVQITTPDTLYDVRIEDRVPAGLEPLDPRIFEGVDTTISSTGDPLYWYWYYWSPFELPQISIDNVLWKSTALNAGTYTVTYQALAVTPGVFIWPPSHAFSDTQEEVTGLSQGGNFVVTSEFIPESEVLSYLEDLDVQIPDGTAELKDCEKNCSEIPGAYCDPYKGECVEGTSLVKSLDIPEDTSSVVTPRETDDDSDDDSVDDDTAWCDIEISGRDDDLSYDRINGIYTFFEMNEDDTRPQYIKSSRSGTTLYLFYDEISHSWRIRDSLDRSDGSTLAYVQTNVQIESLNGSDSPNDYDKWQVKTRRGGFESDGDVRASCV